MSCTDFIVIDGDGMATTPWVACSCSGGLPDAYYGDIRGDCYDQNGLGPLIKPILPAVARRIFRLQL